MSIIFVTLLFLTNVALKLIANNHFICTVQSFGYCLFIQLTLLGNNLDLIIIEKIPNSIIPSQNTLLKMPEKTQKRKLGIDQSTSQVEIENYYYPNDENASLSEQDFEDISSKIENRLSERLRDTEFGQREILRLIENLTSKVDNLSNPASEQCSSALRSEFDTDPVDNSGNENAIRNVGSNNRARISSLVS